MSDDLRATLREAFSAAETANTESAAAVSDSAASAGSAGGSPGLLAEQPEQASGGPGEAPEADAGAVASAASRARDATGKFTKAEAAQAAKKVATPATQAGAPADPASPGGVTSPTLAGAASPAPPAETVRPPVSLTPAEREHFAKAPPEVQKAFARLDGEVRKTMQEAAPARKFQQEMSQVFAPHQALLRETGLGPAQITQSLLQTVHQLRTGSEQARADIFASLMRSYPTDINALAKAIDAPAPQQPPMDPRAIAAQVRQEVMQGFHQERQQALTAKATQEVEAFAADPANEFFEDVWPEMAGLIDAAKARGVEMSLKEAHTRAVWANPEKRAILQQREQAKAANAQQASTQRASAAGSSVRNQPASPVNGAKPGDLRADIMASITRLNNGR